MTSHEYMRGEVEIQVDDTVLEVRWGPGAGNRGWGSTMYNGDLCIMYCEFLNTQWTNSQTSVTDSSVCSYSIQRALVHHIQ